MLYIAAQDIATARSITHAPSRQVYDKAAKLCVGVDPRRPAGALGMAAARSAAIREPDRTGWHIYALDVIGGGVVQLTRANHGLLPRDIDAAHELLAINIDPDVPGVPYPATVRRVVDRVIRRRRRDMAIVTRTRLRDITSSDAIQLASTITPAERSEIPNGAWIQPYQLAPLTRGELSVADLLRGTYTVRAALAAYLTMWGSSHHTYIAAGEL